MKAARRCIVRSASRRRAHASIRRICSIILGGRSYRVASITLELGTSHGPMLSVRPDTWPERVKADRANPQHFFKGKTCRVIGRRQEQVMRWGLHIGSSWRELCVRFLIL